MSRLTATFETLRRERRTGLVTYVTAGHPDRRRSSALLRTLDRAGADVIEIGVPFSDPLADGPVIQRSSERALAQGMTLASALDLVAEVRADVRAPLVLFSYANPLYRMGLRSFAERAAAAGVDGVLALDVPAEESDELRAELRTQGIDLIFLLSPTTTDERMALAGRLGNGFLYAISRLGVTGARDTLAEGVDELVARIRRATDLPVAVGFGIAKPEHVAAVGRSADAAVVGSALVRLIEDEADNPALHTRVEAYVRALAGAAAGVAVNLGAR